MMRGWWSTLLAFGMFCAVPVLADPPELGAPEGSEATAKIGPRTDRYELPVGAFTRDAQPVLELRGSVIWHAFRLQDRETTVAAVAEGYRAEIESLGLETLLDCANRDCGGFDFRFGISLLPAPQMRMDVQDFHQFSVRRERDDAHASILISRVLGSIYVQIVTVEPTGKATQITKAPEPSLETQDVAPERPDDLNLMAKLQTEGHVQLDGVEFATGGAQLSEVSASALDGIAAVLKSQPGLDIVIVGHSDNEGGLDPNIALSRSRANAVLEALAERGVSRDQLQARGIGYLSPLVSNATAEGRARNRRVEIVLAN
ncbi:MAG: OmpA family protein [Pseudomonadota bacterium]